MTGTSGALFAAVFLACAVEAVEAVTIVLAAGTARRAWRSAGYGVLAGLAALAVITAALGPAVTAIPLGVLRLVVGGLLLVFGLQWLRKAILRAAGLKALHDEEEAFRAEREAALRAGDEQRLGLDWFAFVVSFKAVLLEGLEVVFIVLTFGVNADSVPLAAAGAAAAGLLVLASGAILHRPLARVPENTLKFAVGLLLATFGTFWSVEGLGFVTQSQESLAWPGGDAAILGLLAAWSAVSYAAVLVLRHATAEAV